MSQSESLTVEEIERILHETESFDEEVWTKQAARKLHAAWNRRPSTADRGGEASVAAELEKTRRIFEDRLEVARRADPADAPFPLVGNAAKDWHAIHAEAYRDVLEMLPAALATTAGESKGVQFVNVLEDAAKAAFVKAQSVYRGDYDRFPLKYTWETTDETVREGWRSIAYAVLEAAHMPPLGTQPEPRQPRDVAAILAAALVTDKG